MSIYYIGIGGVARSGKDSLARALRDTLGKKHPTLKVEIVSLSGPLKLVCKDFIKENLGLDVFSNKSEDKSIFRDMLVWFGKVKRIQSGGLYWTSLLDQSLLQKNINVCIIPDIRYQEYENDEIFWLKNKENNSFIHIKRKINESSYQEPANNDEASNDPIIRRYADVQLTLNHFSDLNDFKQVAEEIYEQKLQIKLKTYVN